MKPSSKKIILLIACVCFFTAVAFCGNKPKREIYQLTVYQYTTAAQETMLNNYLKNPIEPVSKYGPPLSKVHSLF